MKYRNFLIPSGNSSPSVTGRDWYKMCICYTSAVLIILMAVLVAPQASADTFGGEEQVNSQDKLQLRTERNAYFLN